MSSYVVVGASRGIGLEFVLQLAARPGVTVFAVVRSMQSATHLLAAIRDLPNVHIHEADVCDHVALKRVAGEVSEITGGKLDVLIHNAGRMDWPMIHFGFEQYPNLDTLDADLIETFKINTLGVIHSITVFLPLLRSSTVPAKKIAVISSGAADTMIIRKAELGHTAAYAMTKAATNMATAKWAVNLKEENIAVVALSPGVVDISKTRGESGNPAVRAWAMQLVERFKSKGIKNMDMQTPVEAVAAQLKTIDELTMERTGMFLTHDGHEWAV